MKTKFILLAAACATLAACNKNLEEVKHPAEEVIGQITFSLNPEQAPQSKAVTAYTTAQAYESQVNKVQVFVFGSDGAINFYQNLGTSLTGTISTTAGAKTVWAVINGPDLSTIGSLSALQSTAIDLAANSINAATGFVMAGSANVTVTGGATAECGISVSRLVSRVALKSIVNKLPESYGAVTIDRVFLSNVVGNQNIAGNAAVATWYNQNGRADEATRNAEHIIDGGTYKASCADLTFKSVAQSIANAGNLTPSTPYLFYSFPNSSTTAPAGFQSTFAAQRTVLTIAATVSGTKYYYPVVLDDATLDRNKTYTVAVTLTGLGSNDPNKAVSKGNISVSISVSGWTSGATYDETI